MSDAHVNINEILLREIYHSMQCIGETQMKKSTFCHPRTMEKAEYKTTISDVMNITPNYLMSR